jgi:hypothetical protein
MITKEQQLIFAIARSKLADYTTEDWLEISQAYQEFLEDTAELNEENVEDIREDFSFIEWFDEFLEDQTWICENADLDKD